jgi:CRP-like cAMP-binding protein
MQLHGGMYFGDVSSLLGEPVTASVFARTTLRCAIVERDRLFPFLLANPSVTLRLLQAEARRFSDAARWHA